MIGIATKEDLDVVNQDIQIIAGELADTKQRLEATEKKLEDLITETKKELDALKKKKAA